MKRKLFATLGLVVASMMVFAGCGGSGDATTSPSADANAASGSKLMHSATFGDMDSRMATQAAMRMTFGSWTFVSTSTPVFSP